MLNSQFRDLNILTRLYNNIGKLVMKKEDKIKLSEAQSNFSKAEELLKNQNVNNTLRDEISANLNECLNKLKLF